MDQRPLRLAGLLVGEDLVDRADLLAVAIDERAPAQIVASVNCVMVLSKDVGGPVRPPRLLNTMMRATQSTGTQPEHNSEPIPLP